MYSITKFADRQMFACSVPPPANKNLDEGFQELSRIHFYLGHASIDFMIEAVEKASLTDIEKGKIQLYFAVKEIQDYLQSALGDIHTNGEDRFNPGLYFDKTFNNILNHTIEVLNDAHKKPSKKDNAVKIETMLGLVQEVKIFNKTLQDSGVNTANTDSLVNQIVEKYQKILDLQPHYPGLKELKSFDSYEEQAKQSVLAQLSEPYEFNYAKLTSIYLKDDNWVYTLHHILEAQKDIDTDPNYKFNPSEAQRLKDAFLTQVKSFNRLFKNGVVNYTLSFAAALSKECFINVETSKIPAEAFFDRSMNYHKKGLESVYGDYGGYHKGKIEELEENKEDFIQKKNDDKVYHEQYVTILTKQEQNIFQSLEKVRNKLFNTALKSTLTLTGDIKKGFVIGEFNNGDDILLAHKDTTVNAQEAIFAMTINKKQYDELVENNKLIFDIDFKHGDRKNGANFFNYGQFLQEISDSRIQQQMFGYEFNLVDNTTLEEIQRKRMTYM
jgi:hypothetical protein